MLPCFLSLGWQGTCVVPQCVREQHDCLNYANSSASEPASQTQTYYTFQKTRVVHLGRRLSSGSPCVLRAKLLGCRVLKSRGLISADFDCKLAVKYSSTVAIVFEERWRRTIDMFETGVTGARTSMRELSFACLMNTSDNNCAACRTELIKQVRVDVRLSESEALPIIKSCTNTSVEVIYAYFAKNVGYYFDYNTLTPSYMLEKAPTATSPLFRGLLHT